LRPIVRALTANKLNILLLAAPVSWVVERLAPDTFWVFIIAAISLIPLAGIIGLGTEELAHRAGPAFGGFLNATFGNAAELIIAIVALHGGHVELVKASITGSIVGNLLLVLGASFFVGGIGRTSQRFHRTAATNAATMLFLAVVALVMPAVFDLALYGTLKVEPVALRQLSICTALVLMSAYIGSLIYAFARQKDLLRPTKQERGESTLTTTHAVMLLAIGTILTTIQAEMLVGALGPALSEFGFTEMFVGVIVVAIIGNAAEHYSAIVAAHRDNMTLAVEISIGSSAQIALFVGPAVVLYSYAIGRPMTLLFNAFEIAAIALSVLATHMAVLDGESNWVEGMQLMSVYMILAFAFYFVP
jgi:Ca2+:H+ antiporter